MPMLRMGIGTSSLSPVLQGELNTFLNACTWIDFSIFAAEISQMPDSLLAENTWVLSAWTPPNSPCGGFPCIRFFVDQVHLLSSSSPPHQFPGLLLFKAV